MIKTIIDVINALSPFLKEYGAGRKTITTLIFQNKILVSTLLLVIIQGFFFLYAIDQAHTRLHRETILREEVKDLKELLNTTKAKTAITDKEIEELIDKPVEKPLDRSEQ